MSLRIFLLTVAALLVFPMSALSFQGYVQSFGDNATIAWGNGEIAVIRSLGTPGEDDVSELTPLSIRKAATSARKQMLDMILSTRIDAKRTVSAYLSEDAELAARVRGLVQNSPLERPAVFDDGGVVRASERFRAKLAELILPTTIQFQSGIPPKLSSSTGQDMNYNNSVPEAVGSENGGYTGVIIDARGMQVTPALTPVIYGQDGVGAYGPFLVSRANAIEKGVAAYATTTEAAALRYRVGDRPLVVRALKAFGSWRTDLIISTPMAQLVRAVMDSPQAARECRMVIAVTPPAAAKAEAEPVVETEEAGEVQ